MLSTPVRRHDTPSRKTRLDHPGLPCGPRVACWRPECADWKAYRPVELVRALNGDIVLVVARCHAVRTMRPDELPVEVMDQLRKQVLAA